MIQFSSDPVFINQLVAELYLEVKLMAASAETFNVSA